MSKCNFRSKLTITEPKNHLMRHATSVNKENDFFKGSSSN